MPGSVIVSPSARDARNARDRLARRSEIGDRRAREQCTIAADVVAVMMRIHDRGGLELLAIEVCEHLRGVVGIDDGGTLPSRRNRM